MAYMDKPITISEMWEWEEVRVLKGFWNWRSDETSKFLSLEFPSFWDLTGFKVTWLICFKMRSCQKKVHSLCLFVTYFNLLSFISFSLFQLPSFFGWVHHFHAELFKFQDSYAWLHPTKTQSQNQIPKFSRLLSIGLRKNTYRKDSPISEMSMSKI